MEHYNLAGVPLYIIVDTIRMRGESFVRLLGYRQTETIYAVLPPDERGWLWLEPLQLWLGIRDNELYCYDEHGVQIGDYTAVTDELAAERQARVDAESQAALERQARSEAEARATQAEARLHELEAELRRLRGD